MKKELELLENCERLRTGSSFLYIKLFSDESGCVCEDVDDEELFDFENINELKRGLKDKIKELEKPKLEVGKWYKTEDDVLFHVVSIDSNSYKTYGNYKHGWGGDWRIGKKSNYAKKAVEATKEEVEKALIKEAKKRGFKEGVTFRSATGSLTAFVVEGSLYLEYSILYSDGRGCIFYDGNWAEIIEESKELTIEQIQDKLGYKIKIVE